MWDSTPWFVGGGAQHSPEVARLLAHAATMGAEGIVAPADLRVTPLAVPGSSVRILSGAALIPNKAAGGTAQTYVARNPTEDVVAIAATGSAGGRSDLIVARVEDPFMPGEPWTTPTDRTKGPYVFTRVISNVSPSTETLPAGQSGIPLARIDVPANTATITASMIKDLRALAQPRESSSIAVQPCVGANVLLTNTAWFNWPANTFAVKVPNWATHAVVVATWTSIAADGPADVNTRLQFGPLIGNAISYFDYNGNLPSLTGFVENRAHVVADEFDVRALRGQNVAVRTQARRAYETLNRGGAWVTDMDKLIFDVRFFERTV